jgi:hypothetical protein
MPGRPGRSNGPPASSLPHRADDRAGNRPVAGRYLASFAHACGILAACAAGVDVPVTCSLAETDAQAQLGEWRSLLATSAAGVDQISRTELSLRLRNDLAALEAPIWLAQRGKACCPFSGFTILIGADDLALHVSVPGEGSWLLSEFARSAGAHA